MGRRARAMMTADRQTPASRSKKSYVLWIHQYSTVFRIDPPNRSGHIEGDGKCREGAAKTGAWRRSNNRTIVEADHAALGRSGETKSSDDAAIKSSLTSSVCEA